MPAEFPRRDDGARSPVAKGVAWALLAGELAVALYCAGTRFPPLWRDRWVQDDAYVSFRYARHLVQGDGLVYNAGDRVEGYTNFLWTMLAALPLAGGADDPLPFMHLVSAGLWAGSYLLLLALSVRLWADGLWAAPLAVVPLAYHWSFNMWFMSGMETPLVCFLTIAAVYCFTLDPARRPLGPFGASLCAVLLTMTRPDGVTTFAALALAALVFDRRHLRSALPRRRLLLAWALPVAAILLPYQAWRIWYYGSLLPNTYYAKVAYLTFYARGWRYLTTYVSIYDLAPFLPIVLAGAVLARTGAAARFLWAALLVTAAAAFYVVRLGGDFMEWRFLTPVSGVLYPAIVVAAAVVGQRACGWLRWRVPAEAGGWLASVACAALLAHATIAATGIAQTEGAPDQETIALLRRYTDPGRFDWRTVGTLCDQVLPRDAAIATTSAGIIPYFCDRRCLDLHGLTDAVIARERVDPDNRGRTGHEHWLQDWDVMRQRGVDVIVEWADPNLYPRAMVTPPHEGAELVSMALPDGRFVDFTLLNPAVGGAAFRRDPRLVFYDADKVADKQTLQALREHFAAYAVVDTLDWEDATSEAAHHFIEVQPPGAPYRHSWHTKLLAYLPPLDGVRLEDNGRRIWGTARWLVFNVSATRDLVMVARFDYTGSATYDVYANGRRTAVQLAVPSRPAEAWGEISAAIPKEYLLDGTNEIRIDRLPESEWDAEWYYMWFLQAPPDGDAPGGQAPGPAPAS